MGSEETMSIKLPMTAIRALKEMQERHRAKFATAPSYKDIAAKLIITANNKEAAK